MMSGVAQVGNKSRFQVGFQARQAFCLRSCASATRSWPTASAWQWPPWLVLRPTAENGEAHIVRGKLRLDRAWPQWVVEYAAELAGLAAAARQFDNSAVPDAAPEDHVSAVFGLACSLARSHLRSIQGSVLRHYGEKWSTWARTAFG
jgi:hypothetical protein